MKAKVIFGLIAGAVGLMISIFVSSIPILLVLILLGAAAGYFTARATPEPIGKGARPGAFSGAIAGLLVVIGWIISEVLNETTLGGKVLMVPIGVGTLIGAEVIPGFIYIGVGALCGSIVGRFTGPTNVEGLIKTLVTAGVDANDKHQALVALRKIGTPAVEPLIAALRNNQLYGRDDLATALGWIKDKRAVEPLIAEMKKEDFKGEFANALGTIGDPRAVEPLIQALRYSGTTLFAIQALGKLGDQRAVDPLKRIVNQKDEKYDVRKSAVDALKKLGVVIPEKDLPVKEVDQTPQNLAITLWTEDEQTARRLVSDQTYLLSTISAQNGASPFLDALLNGRSYSYQVHRDSVSGKCRVDLNLT